MTITYVGTSSTFYFQSKAIVFIFLINMKMYYILALLIRNLIIILPIINFFICDLVELINVYSGH